MRPDAEGFLYPVIDDQKCIQFGLCYQICPASRPLHVDHGTPSFYAFCEKDDVRLKSSSGGAFTYLAEWVLDHDGVVCGAAFAEDYLTVHHVLIDTREALVSIQQSKYLRSSAKNSDCKRNGYWIPSFCWIRRYIKLVRRAQSMQENAKRHFCLHMCSNIRKKKKKLLNGLQKKQDCKSDWFWQ